MQFGKERRNATHLVFILQDYRILKRNGQIDAAGSGIIGVSSNLIA
jgi:hypothetical protein